MMPCARTRSRIGSQVVKALVRLGKHPASPAPKSARVTISDGRFQTQAVAAVKKDHQTTIRISTLRAPQRSPIQPPGISNSAQAQGKAKKAQPICAVESPRSRLIAGAACEMQTRSI